jgi:endogenous inhibitor of DNA gyrase (YacG/DUF329 family)
MAKEKARTITVNCNGCGTRLYRYSKTAPGHLVKCYVDKIVEDYTNGDLKCPKCGHEFARKATIHNRPAYKIIQGKVFVKGRFGG